MGNKLNYALAFVAGVGLTYGLIKYGPKLAELDGKIEDASGWFKNINDEIRELFGKPRKYTKNNGYNGAVGVGVEIDKALDKRATPFERKIINAQKKVYQSLGMPVKEHQHRTQNR